MAGPQRVCDALAPERLRNATHLVWATGGGMVPETEIVQYLAKGR